IPLRDLGVGARIRPVWLITLGRIIPCHCLSVPALRLIAATGAPVDLYRALLCRHRCQSSINTVTRRRTQGINQTGLQRADGWCVEFLVNILRGHQTCTAAGVNTALQAETRTTLLVDPAKATKGRRMSKKTRKKSSKGSSTNSAPKAAAAKAARAGAKASVKTPAAKARKAVAKKAGKAAKTIVAKASHEPASKPL